MEIEKIHNILDQLMGNIPGNVEFNVLPASHPFMFNAVIVNVLKTEKKFRRQYSKLPFAI